MENTDLHCFILCAITKFIHLGVVIVMSDPLEKQDILVTQFAKFHSVLMCLLISFFIP